MQNALCEDCHAEFNVGGPMSHRLYEPGKGRTDMYGIKT